MYHCEIQSVQIAEILLIIYCNFKFLSFTISINLQLCKSKFTKHWNIINYIGILLLF
jgi:hypothetical protein